MPDYEALRISDEEEFVAFYNASYRSIAAQVAIVTGDLIEAEEVTQAAFLDAATKWHIISRQAAPGVWVRQVAMNRAGSGLRRFSRRARGVTRQFKSSESGEQSTGEVMERLAVARALKALPFEQRVVLALHYHGGLSVAEIGRELSISAGTVHFRLTRGGQRLCDMLRDRQARS